MHAMIVRGKKAKDAARDCGIRLATFQNMKAPTEMIEKMFDNVFFSLDTLKKQNVPSGYADFEFQAPSRGRGANESLHSALCVFVP